MAPAPQGFRQSMAWLHTWCGLVCGWLLCAIFLTGTLSVFREPITRWMEARPSAATVPGAAGGASDAALQAAAGHLAAHGAGARFWRIELPREPGDALRLAWPPAAGARGGPQTAALDPASGALLPAPWGRRTEGGRHFMTFHYTLHGGVPGYWLVGWLSVGMLVALVSGVVVHRRIFADFFTFRPAKGQRSWLDAHNATAVLALPFLFMIVYTGLAIFYTSYLPWPLRAVYGADGAAHGRFQQELTHQAPPMRRARSGTAAPLHGLAPLLAQAQALTGQPPRLVVVEQPGDAAMVVRIHTRASGDPRTLHQAVGSVAFDGVDGAVLQVQRPLAGATPASAQAHGVMAALHLAHFGGWTIKWLYFFSGLAGTAMMATGTILFGIKRRRKVGKEAGPATPWAYRAAEALNVAALAGTAVACIAYLWCNRLLPANLPGREAWEIRSFLCAWLAAALHAACRPAARAWVEQLSAAAVLCLALPLLNRWTTGQQAWRHALAGDWQQAGVELVALGFGVALAWGAWQVRRALRKGIPG